MRLKRLRICRNATRPYDLPWSHPPTNRSVFGYKNCSFFLVEYSVLGKPEVSDRIRGPCFASAISSPSAPMAETVVLKVGMSCEGCVGAVKRVLTKMEGVESFDVDLKEQKVTVKGNVKPEAVLQTVSKTGKKTSFWEAEPETKESTASTATNTA
ncbi:copper transport protein [Musa troglodytarum]|uniref:Copper transport protein n=1 Tax=Musa troglodytarum TaxID=320322 RepID=A0A9E7KAG7_9LILI|nr:copper transport protein [Musa troglodytarum]